MYPRLLAPLVLEGTGHTLRNRAVMGSMHTGLEEGEGMSHDMTELAEFFARRAQGGVGLIVTGGVAPNAAGRVSPFAATVSNEKEARRHKVVTDAVKGVNLGDAMGDDGHHRTRIIMQILHAGRYAYHPWAVGASKKKAPIAMFKPKMLSSGGVESTIKDFANCAYLSKVHGGYDGVEVMGSEGYLINQFIASRTNDRSDAWGGEYANRIKLARGIVGAVRDACGPDFIIMFRLSMLDLVEQGSSWEEIVELAQAVEDAGATIINTGIGWHEARIPTIATCVPRAAFTPVTHKMMLEGAVNIPLVSTNRINTPQVAEKVLSDGHSDLVSMARPFLADPDIVIKAAQNRADEVNPCIACNQACLDHSFVAKRASCLVNPVAGYEATLGKRVRADDVPESEQKRIAVVGSGPAGMAFATTASLRGHHVTMFEKADRIGGQFNMAKRIPGKEEFAGTLRYFDTMLKERAEEGRVEVRLETEADAAALVEEGFDAVVTCTGVSPRIPDIQGVDHPSVLSYWDVLAGGMEDRVGERVAVLGAGGIGFDVSEFIHHLPMPGEKKENGKANEDVYSEGCNDDPNSPSLNVDEFWKKWGIDPSIRGGHTPKPPKPPSEQDAAKHRTIYMLQRKKGKAGKKLGRTTGWIHRDSVKRMGVQTLGGVSYEKIDDEGLHISIKDKKQVLDVDTCILCTGQESLRTISDELNALDPSLPVFTIGGAHEAGELDAKRAIDQGVRLAASIESSSPGCEASLEVAPNLTERAFKWILGR